MAPVGAAAGHGSRLVDAYISGLKLIPVHLAMTPAGLAFGCGPAPAGPEIEAATYATQQQFADRLIEAAAPELAELSDVIGLAELTAELVAIAEEVGVQVLTVSGDPGHGRRGRRADRAGVRRAPTAPGLKPINRRYREQRLAAVPNPL